MNGHFSHLPILNYGCKIKCLHQGSSTGSKYWQYRPVWYEIDSIAKEPQMVQNSKISWYFSQNDSQDFS